MATVEVFRTNVKKKSEGKLLVCMLSEVFPSSKINMDLSDRDRVLRVEGDNMEASRIMMFVEKYGFKCEVMD
jgi:hypothetical protein